MSKSIIIQSMICGAIAINALVICMYGICIVMENRGKSPTPAQFWVGIGMEFPAMDGGGGGGGETVHTND